MDTDKKTESPFDTIFKRNVPHILEKIFFYLDFESYLKCIEVKNTWKNMLLSDSFQKRAKKFYRLEEKLRNLSFAGNSDAVHKLVSCGLVEVNCQNESGKTPLHYALMGTHEATKTLLDLGADPNKKDKQGRTPLFLICRSTRQPGDPGEREYPNVVKLLLQKGADPNAKDKRGLTPLQHAASDGLATTVRILLDGGARPQNNHSLGRAVIYRGDGTVYY